jgi:hypothetical protein
VRAVTPLSADSPASTSKHKTSFLGGPVPPTGLGWRIWIARLFDGTQRQEFEAQIKGMQSRRLVFSS